jgi:hypothetical protein
MDDDFIVINGIDDAILGNFDSVKDAAKFIAKKKEALKNYDKDNPRPSHRFHIYQHVDTL